MPDRADLDALKRANAALEAKLNRLKALKQERAYKTFEARKQALRAYCSKAVKEKKMLAANRDLIFSSLDKENPDLDMLMGLAVNHVNYKEAHEC